jgi:sugar phosphate isomerase/epimerase
MSSGKKEKIFANIIRNLFVLRMLCGNGSVKVGLENAACDCLGADKNPLFFSEVEKLAYFCRQNDLKLVFNAGNWATRPQVRTGNCLAQNFREVADDVGHVRISDCIIIPGEHGRNMVPGEGELGRYLAELIRAVRNSSRPYTVGLDVKDINGRYETRRALQWLASQLI